MPDAMMQPAPANSAPQCTAAFTSHRAPLISVCIPVFNGERYIAEAIESVLTQTCQDFEIVISDNCSTDNTLAIIRSYNDPRIRCFSNSANLGQAVNLRRALELPRGKYCKILCADDFLYKDCLKVQAEILEKPENQSVVLVFCRRDVVGHNGEHVMTWGYPGRSGRRSGAAIVRKCIHYSSNLIGEPPCFMFRTAILQSGRIVSDLDLPFCADLLLHGDGYSISEPHCAFRLSDISLTVQETYENKGWLRKSFLEFIECMRTDPHFRKHGISWIDSAIGRTMIRITPLLRRIVYRLAIKGSPRPQDVASRR
jgi:glycosyltransferase involved in cell wall biosynthesis